MPKIEPHVTKVDPKNTKILPIYEVEHQEGGVGRGANMWHLEAFMNRFYKILVLSW